MDCIELGFLINCCMKSCFLADTQMLVEQVYNDYFTNIAHSHFAPCQELAMGTHGDKNISQPRNYVL